MVALAALAFIGIFFFGVPFPIIIAAAAVIGFAGNAAGLEWSTSSPPPTDNFSSPPVVTTPAYDFQARI